MARGTSGTMVVLVASIAMSLAGCDDGGAASQRCSAEDDFDGCSPEELEEALSDFGGKDDGFLTYESGYTNAVVVATTEAGLDVVAILGSHSPDYPYLGSSSWGNVLLLVGDEQLRRTEPILEGLRLDGFDGSGPGRIELHTDLLDDAGRRVPVDLSWEFDRTDGGSRFLGLWPLGLQWTPALLTTASAGEITVGDEVHALTGAHGVAEVGELTNLKSTDFAVQYDALFVLPRPEEEAFAFVDIAARTLPASRKSKLLDPVLRKKARVEDTFTREATTEGNTTGVVVPAPADETVVVFEDVFDAGLADVRRQVVRLRDGSGRELLGLRDVFVPR